MNPSTSLRARCVAAILLLIGGSWVLAPRLWTQDPGRQDASTALSAGASKVRYQCPMHPGIVSDKPGDCPICGMRLQKAEEAPAAATAKPAAEKKEPLYYRHPMRPDVTSPTPKKDEMGMDYIPVYEEGAGAKSSEVPGHGSFTLTPERQQLIGVRTGKVERRALAQTIRAPGRIAHDPDLYNSLTEYRQAVAAQEGTRESPSPEVRERADALVRAAALRLRQLGFDRAQIDELGRSTAPLAELLVPGRSPWLFLQVYQMDVGLVTPGQKVRATALSLPGRVLTGEVKAVDTMLDPVTRSLRVRARLDPPPVPLTHEIYLDGEIEVPLGTLLALPQDAVLDTGEHQVVFVRKAGGEFQPRSVRLGRQARGYYEVLGGVYEGEEVVTSANFLIDSESRFRAALKAYEGGHRH